MSDPLVVQSLKSKRAEISGAIAAYQGEIAGISIRHLKADGMLN